MSHVQLMYLPASHGRRSCVKKEMVSAGSSGVSVRSDVNVNNIVSTYTDHTYDYATPSKHLARALS